MRGGMVGGEGGGQLLRGLQTDTLPASMVSSAAAKQQPSLTIITSHPSLLHADTHSTPPKLS